MFPIVLLPTGSRNFSRSTHFAEVVELDFDVELLEALLEALVEELELDDPEPDPPEAPAAGA